MLGFFFDAAMTRPVTSASPKRFLSPTSGITKTGRVYLGDPYWVAVTLAAAAGAPTLSLSDASEFPASGQATVADQTISYTGISGSTLTGVTGLPSTLVGAQVYPHKQWLADPVITLVPFGAQAALLQVSVGAGGAFTFPGMPLLFNTQVAIAVRAPALAIDVRVVVPAGDVAELANWSISAGPFYPKSLGDNSPPASTAKGMTAVMAGYVNRQDQALPQRLRLLPSSRDVSLPAPGFPIGAYRWRDDQEINGQTIVPTSWRVDPASLGGEKFVAGIGCRDDLAPQDLVQRENSIYLQIKRGFYFTGPQGYYLPASPQLDLLSSLTTTLELSASPRETVPMFVGTYALDSQGFYEKGLEYRYQTAAAVERGTDLPPYYYTLDRIQKKITLNCSQKTTDIYLGTISGQAIDYFDVPVYPVDSVESIYVKRAGGVRLTAVNWTFDRDQGVVVIANPAGIGSSIAAALQGEIVMARCAPALAVLYDTGTDPLRILDSVDLNPAFAGISGGFVYLQHSRQHTASLVLSCDKPRIDVPATLSSIIDLVAYGPVYFGGDYSLLQVTAFSKIPDQTIAGVDLEVEADPGTFTGSINYKDPLTQTVRARTGADGIANLVFRPAANYGYYIPATAAAGGAAGLATTTIADDTLVLPSPIPISQLYSAGDAEPWLVTTYSVANNNPLLGMVDADPAQGEILWATSGTPGAASYKTNGERHLFASTDNILRPARMLDGNGRDWTDALFTGNVVRLVYSQALPTRASVGAYFVTFLQRTMLRVRVVGSSVVSNYIMLQMQNPVLIDDEIWLILNDSIHGILNQYRLGWTLTRIHK